ncbi:FliC domain protein [Rhizoctonia solani AG-3 Rhs1AP]|uniref:FliC domain protein n=2 Tax=Rhizoctonia solani AG-3 TaxID=1086053 RepID=A0A074SHF8_9AGAM|nr:FliC domain protein [Rhizoctonia solani AG-3 Rhs1AP]KEP49467.1 FliC domain protein [Rhizoctonia solani 123E]
MRTSATFAFLGFVASVAAQTVHTVIVGGPGQLTYTPSCLWPAVGDIVNFEFHEKNHTATQSSFAEPCKKLTDAAGIQSAFDSGYHPVAAGTAAGFPVMSFNVTDDKPKWFYCAQGSHCSAGMVFAINPPKEGNTFEAFLANAKNSAVQTPAPAVPAPPATTTSAAATVTPAPDGVVTVTQTVTLGASTWTTTYGSAPGSAAPTPNPQPVVHVVTVGGNGTLTFNPPSVQAAPRDIISFQFRSKNHTVTQSTFADPCRKFEFTSTSGQIGFDSGFVPVTADANAFPTWNVTVNDTAPIWAYCRQANHCGGGMVFALNAVESGNKSFAAFQALAKQINGTGSGTPASSSGAPSASATASPGSVISGASHLAVAGSWVGIVTSIAMMLL